MLTIEIENDLTGNLDVANYRYEVKINDRPIQSGIVRDHVRLDGYAALILRVALSILGKNPTSFQEVHDAQENQSNSQKE